VKLLRWSFASVLALFIAQPLFAAEPGRASGTVTIDGKPTALAFAVSHEEEDLYDSSKKNTAVVLLDREADASVATDDWEIARWAKQGELVALALRLDGTKLVNVRLNCAGIEGTLVLPGQWFEYRPATVPAGQTAGSLKLAARESDGHTYACAVEFTAAPAPAPEAEPAAEPPAVELETPAPQPDLPPATTSTLDPDSLTPLMVKAMMEKDEDQVLKLLKLGANPNARDPYGIPMLNWAVMSCLPKAVQALVDAKADLTYERAPGMTILVEAGACPEAEKILRAASAR
jgi:hypothetical protein